MVIRKISKDKREIYLKGGLISLLIIFSLIIGAKGYNSRFDNSLFSESKPKKTIKGKDIAYNLKKKGQKAINQTIDKGNKMIGQVLGEAVRVVNQTASRSGKMVNDFLFRSTTKKLVDQINRLPQEQRKRVIQDICPQD